MTTEPEGLRAIRAEMARQREDALASIAAAGERGAEVAASLKRTGRLLLLGMGASHAAGRAVEPLYRLAGIEALALPLSEALATPLPGAARTVIVTSQSGESAEVARWLDGMAAGSEAFGITLEAGSTLGRRLPCLVGLGGSEKAFAATRSLTLTLALHLPVLEALGVEMTAARRALESSAAPEIEAALAAMTRARAVVTSGRRLQGLAEAIALGLTELSRRPCFALEGGQLRHGPMEMLGPEIGAVHFCSDDETAGLVRGLAQATAEAGSPTVLFDASGGPTPKGVVRVSVPKTEGLAAVLSLLPAAQGFMVGYAAARVADVGTPLRSSKITRVE